MTRQSWSKKLSVDKRIVRLLSAATYEDFPGAIREMVSNAYDADATDVHIEINLKGDFIEVTDDGNGMTPDEFDFFLRIAGQQRGRKLSPEFNRRRIGQFGIGFLAVFPFGEHIQIRSTARRLGIRFEATIPAQKYFKPNQKFIDVEDIPVNGFEIKDEKLLEEHGTIIRISGLTEMVRRYFHPRKLDIRGKRKTATVLMYKPEQRLRWALEEELPLDYKDDSPYREAFTDLGSSGMIVWLNGKRLFRNSVGSHILENKSWEYNGIKCRYVISTDWKSIAPNEDRYIKQRLVNVGLGRRTSFGLGLEGRAYSRLHWLAGEIRILDGLDHLLSIDRAKFVESAEYDEFTEYFRSRLAHFANYLETVDEAKRDIKRQLSESRAAEVGSKRQVIDRSVNTLRSKGFNVVIKDHDASIYKTSPVSIDVDQKIVEVISDHPDLQDFLVIQSKKVPVRYAVWSISDKFPAVRRASDNAIEVNTAYPLFKSLRYGEIFKKILATILVLSEDNINGADLLSLISKNLPKEFRDLQ